MIGNYCFGEVETSCLSGRIHVPLAVNCKLRCGYCNYSNNRNISENQLPGTSTLSLKTHKDIAWWLKEKTQKYPNIRIIGVAGPGDPLLNPSQLEMFFEIINKNYSDYTVCLCCSGLNFKKMELFLLKQKTLKYITFTINSTNAQTIQNIYHPSETPFNADLFIEEQKYAVNKCVESNLNVKINSVYLPTINDDEIYDLYHVYNKMGVKKFNLIPYKRADTHSLSNLPSINQEKYDRLIANLKLANINVLQKCFKCRSDECGRFFNNAKPNITNNNPTVNKTYILPYKSCYVWGALRYFSQIKDSICLVHGPKGCSFFYRAFLNFVNKYNGTPPRIFSTDFNEHDVIFGGVRKLEDSIVELYNEFHPQIITVLNCCVSEVIGEDIKGVISKLKDKIDCRLLAVQGAGFKGDHKDGMKDACNIIFNEFINPLSQSINKTNSINYIGELNPNNWSIKELNSILSKFDIQVNTIIPTDCSLNDFSEIPFARLNYLVCGSAGNILASKISEKFNIPTIGGMADFLGLENSKQTLEKILEVFNVNSDIPQILYNKAYNKVSVIKHIFCGKKAVVVGGTRRALGYSRILSELGFNVSLIFSEQDEIISKVKLQTLSTNVLYDESPEIIYRFIKDNRPDVVMTTIPELVLPETYLETVQDFFGFSGFVKFAIFLQQQLSFNNKIKILG